MDFLFKDKNGDKCLAKTAYITAFATCMFKILCAGVSIYGFELSSATVDYTGLTQILTVTGAAYWGRSKTKADQSC